MRPHRFWLVCGSYSEYDEGDHWVICVCLDPRRAAEIVRQLEVEEEAFHLRVALWDDVNPPPECPDDQAWTTWYTSVGGAAATAHRLARDLMLDECPVLLDPRVARLGRGRTPPRPSYDVEVATDDPSAHCSCPASPDWIHGPPDRDCPLHGEQLQLSCQAVT